jgi:hypothetical protein
VSPPISVASYRQGTSWMSERRLSTMACLEQGGAWYNETGIRPDALVRFDSGAVTFQAGRTSSGGVHAGTVQPLHPPRNCGLPIHQSSTDRIIPVRLDPGEAGQCRSAIGRPIHRSGEIARDALLSMDSYSLPGGEGPLKRRRLSS